MLRITATPVMPAIPATTHAHQVQRANKQGQLVSWPFQKVMMMGNVVQGRNALGEFFMLSLNKEFYCPEAIMKSCYALTDDYFIHAVKLTNDSTGIYFYNKVGNAYDIGKTAKNFLQLLNENQMRQIVLQETSSLHEEIIKKAFSPAASLINVQNKSDDLTILVSAV
ncbi:hypothetical protein HV337_12115 [Citrobacter freundii]|uniref:hypothetical protein n=1 Tax=Citrobacter freundii TaxID=546 RepID=UPI0015E91D5A|nr:hypothetical protein [Citrobacter freundii]QLR73241.1 hypothetical protein HV337_12115 [Citrobacter freundii]QLY52404.1 hypothetical protein HV186_11860 [Citrobacter freundii]QMG41246.1 hypothetical protein HVY60_11885 [Citrobacter freundii]